MSGTDRTPGASTPLANGVVVLAASVVELPTLDVDRPAVMAAMQTEAAAEAMEYDGVLAETLVILVEA